MPPPPAEAAHFIQIVEKDAASKAAKVSGLSFVVCSKSCMLTTHFDPCENVSDILHYNGRE